MNPIKLFITLNPNKPFPAKSANEPPEVSVRSKKMFEDAVLFCKFERTVFFGTAVELLFQLWLVDII
jgi:hypothetical protein